MCSLTKVCTQYMLILFMCLLCQGGPTWGSYNVPPVVNPAWDSPVPTFNCIIIRRMANEETPMCSGALISKSFVVTVGSRCVLMPNNRLYSPDDLITKFVSYDLDSNEITTYEKLVKKVLLHEGCCRPGNYLGHNDIALIQLKQPIEYNDYIQPAIITKRVVLHHPAVNDHWDLSNLRIFHLPIDFRDAVWFVKTSFISTNICDKLIRGIFHKLQMTCATYFHMGRNDCATDQGSPLSYNGELIGLLLFKQPCESNQFPTNQFLSNQQHCGGPQTAALFVNIGVQSKWIRRNLQRMSNGQEAV